jgi:hypothetical protein
MSTFWEKQHEIGNLPFAWRSTADSLLFASRVLREYCAVAPEPEELGKVGDLTLLKEPSADTRLAPIELMLRAMAVECLLKAIWVHSGHKLSNGGDFKPIPGAGNHDLVQMADRVGVARSERETDLLKRLSHFMECPGRYPMPGSASDLKPTRSLGGGRSSPGGWTHGTDDHAFKALVARLTSLVPT